MKKMMHILFGSISVTMAVPACYPFTSAQMKSRSHVIAIIILSLMVTVTGMLPQPATAATVTLTSVTNVTETVTLNSPSAGTADFYVFGDNVRKSGGPSAFTDISTDDGIDFASDSPVAIAWTGGTPTASSAGSSNFDYGMFGSSYSDRVTYAQFTLTMQSTSATLVFWLNPNGNGPSVSYDITVGGVRNSYTDTSGGGDLQHFTYSISGATLNEVITVRIDNVTGTNGWHNVGFMAAQVSGTATGNAPVITGQTALNTPEDTALTLDVSHLTVTDPDSSSFTLTAGDGTNYRVSGTTVTPDADFDGTLTVPVTVNDGDGDSNVFSLEVTVTAVNDVPVITAQTSLSTPEETALTLGTGHLTISDPDSASFTLTVSGGDSYVVSGSTVTPAENFNGTLTVPVTVNDGSAESGAFALTVTVTPVDDAPHVVNAMADVTAEEDAGDMTVGLENVFGDIDSNASAIVKSVVSNSGETLVSADISENILTLVFLGDQHGTAEVVVAGTADGKSAEDTFTVTVNPVDDPPRPVSDEATRITVGEGDPGLLLNLDGMFTDIDSDTRDFTFTAQSGNPDYVSASLDENLLTLSFPRKDELGTAVVTVTVTSEGQSTPYEFDVTVGPRTHAVSGQVLYFSNNIPLPGIEMILTGTSFYDGAPLSQTAETDEAGFYVFPEVARGDYGLTPFCDNPPDPVTLSATDSSVIARAVVRITELTPMEENAADVTRNGTISGLDASRLARFSAGLISFMSDLGDIWKFLPGDITFSVGTDLENQDFAGAMPGDVTGSHNPGNRRQGRCPTRTSEITADPGATLHIPVVLDDETEIMGVDIRIAYDRDVLVPGEITLAGGVLGNGDYELAVNSDGAGEIAIATFSRSAPLTAAGTLLILNFSVVGGGDALLEFTDFRCNEAHVPEDAGGFEIRGTLSQRLRIGTGTARASDTGDPADYDLSGDGRIGTEDAVTALRRGDMAVAVRVLRCVAGIGF